MIFTPDGRTLIGRFEGHRQTMERRRGSEANNHCQSGAIVPIPVARDHLRQQESNSTLMGPQGPDLKVWDVGTGKEMATYRGTPDHGFPMGLSGNGTRVLLGSIPPGEGSGGKMELWELLSLKSSPPPEREKPEDAPPPDKQEPVGWRADASTADFPDGPAVGQLHGKPFRIGRRGSRRPGLPAAPWATRRKNSTGATARFSGSSRRRTRWTAIGSRSS